MAVPRSPIEDLASAAIGDDALAARWLQQQSDLFGGASPLDALATLEGQLRVRRQLAWFAGERFRGTAHSGAKTESLPPDPSDPFIDLVFQRAGAGPEELLKSGVR